MASAGEIKVNVKVSVTDEMAQRCLNILCMWMDDNPNAAIIVDRDRTERGYLHKARIERS